MFGESAMRQIIHLDMDAFFASVEQLDFPHLRGKPVIVGGAPNERGVVSTCSYEARKFGVHSAMSLSEAYRRCPHGIFVRGRGRRYREVSQQVFAIMADFSPLFEPVSIDEAFLDVTHSQNLFGTAPHMARTIQERVRTELHLSCSLGVATNKFLAKLASDLKKPGGLVVIPEQHAKDLLAPLPVGKIWGVGEKTAAQLHKLGLKTIGDIKKCDASSLERRLGSNGRHIWHLARGEDDRAVERYDAVKSVGHEHTFDIDVADVDALRASLLSLAAKVGRRLRKQGLRARVVHLKLRYLDFTTYSRQTTLSLATDIDSELFAVAQRLFDANFAGRPVRLIGVSAHQLVGEGRREEQLNIFAPHSEKSRQVAAVMDKIKDRHGEKSITYGLITEHEE